MIELKDVAISFAGQEIFNQVNVIINNRDKVGLIGRNGSGKSTLLKILLGELKPDSGQIIISQGTRIGYLQQHLHFSHAYVIDEACSVLSEEQWYESWRVEAMLLSLGFTEEDLLKAPSALSGGFQIKLNLAKLLLSDVDFLLLDEPTNYLDIVTVEWLKKFLQEWEGGLILITHDRNFMDEIIDHTLFLYRHTARKSAGNTQRMYEQITQEEEVYEHTRINENKKRQQIESYIERFRYKSTLASRVQSKIKMLAKQEQKAELTQEVKLDFAFRFADYPSKATVYSAEKLNFGYQDGELLIKNLSFSIERGDKVAIIGRNGKGKSTLLNIIAGLLTPVSGTLKINPQMVIGHFGQTNIERLNPNSTILAEVQGDNTDIPENKIRSICGQMLFSGDSVYKKIQVLSGGERSRVTLAKILLQPVNLLLLDEPDHHLDMESCETLAMAINEFPGTTIFVSHNEYFLKYLPNKLIIFLEDKIVVLEGNYADFLRKGGWDHFQG